MIITVEIQTGRDLGKGGIWSAGARRLSACFFPHFSNALRNCHSHCNDENPTYAYLENSASYGSPNKRPLIPGSSRMPANDQHSE